MAIAQNFPNIVPSLNLSFALTKALDPRITYTRASTATYYGTRTALAEQNLVQYSQEFDNAYWTKAASGSTAPVVTANATTAPDGTATADQVSFPSVTTVGTFSLVTRLTTSLSGTYTFSVYLKGAVGGETVYLMLAPSVSTTSTACVLTTNWQRFDIVGTTTTQLFANVGVDLRDASQSAQSAQTIFMWGAQLEQRSTVTAYTPTTTQPITNYIPVLETAASGVARFDHNPTTFESLGLLIEQQSTNLLLYSEQFDNAYWLKQDVTILANQAIAPDGTLTGDKLIVDATTVTHQLYKLSVVTSSVCATSIYAKAAGVNTFQILDGAGGANGATFNLSSGTVTSVGTGSGVMQSVGNGWYRCTSIATTTGFRLYCPSSSAAETGNGFDGIFIWGAQLEALAFPTSYIPTVASQVTRAADSASITGANFASFYNQAQGTVYCEAALNGNSAASNHRLVWISNNTTQNFISFDETSTTNYRFVVQASNASQANFNLTVASTAQSNKLIGAYKVNDFAASANAGAVGTDTSGDIPLVDRLDLGSGVSVNHINGTIKKFSYYPIALTSTNLQALTS